MQLAVASKGSVIGFNAGPEQGARRLADAEHVEIREYSIIYEIVEDVQLAVNGLLEPVYEEREDARIEVRQVFRVARRNAIGGSYIREGTGTSETSANLRRWENFTGVAGSIESVTWWGLDLDHTGGGNFEECDEIVSYNMERVRKPPRRPPGAARSERPR